MFQVLSVKFYVFEKEGSLRLSDEEKTELVQENTRKLYMAFTRAAQRLVLATVGDLPVSVQELAQKELLTIERLDSTPLCANPD